MVGEGKAICSRKGVVVLVKRCWLLVGKKGTCRGGASLIVCLRSPNWTGGIKCLARFSGTSLCPQLPNCRHWEQAMDS